jgi:chromosome segregation ATPase
MRLKLATALLLTSSSAVLAQQVPQQLDPHRVNAIIAELQAERNNAGDQLAVAQGDLAVLTQANADLQKQLKELKEMKDKKCETPKKDDPSP